MPTGTSTAARRPAATNLRVVSSNTSTNTDLIWRAWNVEFESSVTGTEITNDTIWRAWNSTSTITFGSASAVGTSIRITADGAANDIVWTSWVRQQNLTVEQERELVVRQQEARERQIQIEGEKAKARSRAERLLQENLDAKQREELAQKGFFELDVISKNGERRRYRIHRQWSHSVHQIDPGSGKRLKTLCIHPRELVPVEDSMLAQKLMLEGGMEEELLRIANHS